MTRNNLSWFGIYLIMPLVGLSAGLYDGKIMLGLMFGLLVADVLGFFMINSILEEE